MKGKMDEILRVEKKVYKMVKIAFKALKRWF